MSDNDRDPQTRDLLRRIRELSPEQQTTLREWCAESRGLSEVVEQALDGEVTP